MAIPPPYDPTDPAGFSYETVVKRWPIILTSIVDHLHTQIHNLSLNNDDNDGLKIAEGKQIIEALSKLKYEMARNHALEHVPADGEPHVDLYNAHLANLEAEERHTWFTAPWLFAECYLYRLIRSMFLQKTTWKDFDPFFGQKKDVFTNSGASIQRIVASIKDIDTDLDPWLVFQEMINMCLWGNATDLSLLTHMSLADIEQLQSAEEARNEFILKNDQETVWNHVKGLNEARVDFVLDNAGFELFTDLVFADFLVTRTSYVKKVVFHGKQIPWFVSDVTPYDFEYTIKSLLDDSYFPTSEGPSTSLKTFATRISNYLSTGTFSFVAEPFWTTPNPFWDMQKEAPELYNELRAESGLVIFKGDLNYRKLTGDLKWLPTTPFRDAVGALAGGFPILSLRTNKADVAVGLTQDVVDEVEKKDTKWRVSGKYALVSFLGKD